LTTAFRPERKAGFSLALPSAPAGEAKQKERKLPPRAEGQIFSSACFRSEQRGEFSPAHTSARGGEANLKKWRNRWGRWDNL